MANKVTNGSVPIVAIGASAGGIKAYEGLFDQMPSNLNAAFVIVQHLDPNHKSILSDIVGRYTEMEVKQISDGMEVKEGTVYIIPPNRELELEEGRLRLRPQQNKLGARMQIDHFFQSLKNELKEEAIAVILSGTGSDGSAGIRAIKEEDGLVIAQSPKEAQYEGMPNSAIKTGLVDHIASVEEIPEIIKNYINNSFHANLENFFSEEKNQTTLDKIMKVIQKRKGHDFSQYKKPTLIRRIERRLAINKIESLEDYLDFLEGNPHETDRLYQNMLIRVTNFFRDADAWEALQEEVIPQILDKRAASVRVWVPACATGEEAYTLAMLFADYKDRHKLGNLNIQIFASDVDNEAINIARGGTYSKSLVAKLPEGYLHNYFSAKGETYTVKKRIRDLVIFADHNLGQDPPYSRLDLISCRNLLIYLDSELQQKILRTFQNSLKGQGYLFLGNSETLGKAADLFEVVNRKWKIFRKKAGVSVDFKDKFQVNLDPKLHAYTYGQQENREDEEDSQLRGVARRHVLKRFTPPSVIINPKGEILFFQGRTGQFLEHPDGEPTFNVFKSAREGLRIPLSNAVISAQKKQEEITDHNIRVKTNGDYELVDITVFPINDKGENLLMIVFSKSVVVQKPNEELDAESERIQDLKKELAENRQYLQNTIEELEAANEELKSANEEAQSTNEELQSTNEELETSKEELQSINEELETTNQELQIKNDELTEANNDINNLLASTNIGTIFLDKKLRIFRFTPAIRQIFDLITADIGRPITQFNSYLKYNSLAEDAREVIQSLKQKEIRVESKDGRFFWMRVLPYRTVTDEISGAVITFTDITESKRTQDELDIYKKHLERLVDERTEELRRANEQLKKDAEERRKNNRILKNKEESFRTLVENSRDIIVRMDRELRHVYINKAVEKQTHLKCEDYIGKTNRELEMPESLCETWERELTNVFESGKSSTASFEYDTPDGPKKFHTVMIPEFNSDGEVVTVLASTREIA